MKLVLLLLTFFITAYTHAQTRAGIKGGLNWTDVNSSLPNITNKARADFYVGGFSESSINKKFLFRPELVYSNKGFVTYASEKSTVRLHYLTIPVLAGFRLTKNFSVFAGPEFGYLLSATSKAESIKFNITNSFDRFEKGFALGVAFQLKKGWGAEVRYNYGFEGDRYFVSPDGSRTKVFTNSNRVLQAGLYFTISN